MGDLTIATLCQALANLTHNRCSLVENSNTCRCVDDLMGPKPSTVVSAAPDVMFSEVCLIFFVLGLWLSAIGFCLNQYKSLRRLETQVHYCVNRKDPLNIGDIKIVAREQDSIIYKKKRYSTVLDTHINPDDLKNLHYVQQYIPKTYPSGSPAITALLISREDLNSGIPLSITTPLHNASLPPMITPSHTPLPTHDEVAEDQPAGPVPLPSLASFFSFEMEPSKTNGRLSYMHRTESGRLSVGLTVPHASNPNSLHSSWNSSQICETSRSSQHLSVPTNSLRANRHSDGNISLSAPKTLDQQAQQTHEQLLDPRLIPDVVRRSLLALHRESQENIHVQRPKEKTQSENDVHGAFTPWKIKMKSKLKRTHHAPPAKQPDRPQPRSHSRTLSFLSARYYSNDRERRVSEYAASNQEQRFSTPPPRNLSVSTTPIFRRSLRNYPKYLTQSTSESEATQVEPPNMTSIYVSVDDDTSTATVIENDEQASLTTS